ncbi:HEPN domain protein [Spirochaeta thermophila DSM 6578]|uniref:HEPN domain protein n=1 Tax=Winmispira thermophila (strain ATCC 700085 / DSM 6578 / Z-1203) TaxID=869211 RepID=G0GCF9_WINT7|nr:HEPN domain-containing protein [Spirochaeta thermophila]AEJ62025.1 HEPN domain protein [Spirochaeta thermophila DSM 6578]
MSEQVEKWLLKAEHDLIVARNESKIEGAPTDVICFHCQQAVEKYLKAFLTHHQVDMRRTHNIAELLTLCIEKDRDFEELKKRRIYELTIYAVQVRYPDDFYIPSPEETTEALTMAEYTRAFVMRKLS